MTMKYITTSIFDIFKIGPGPSSSHTIGPMKAANLFIEAAEKLSADILKNINDLHVHLYGSLSATGKGHGTDKAIAAGLMKQCPDRCDPDFVLNLLPDDRETCVVNINDKQLDFCGSNIFFENDDNGLKFQNTVIINLLDQNNEVVFSKTYYSIGGGFILCNGEAELAPPIPPHHFANMRQFKRIHKRTGLSPAEIMRQNEKELKRLSDTDINKQLNIIIDAMLKAVENGLETDGFLPGRLGLERKARDLFRRAEKTHNLLDKNLLYLNAFTLAASEENAAGRIVVTAPTSGASGIIPGVIYYLINYAQTSRENIREGLLVAGLIGCIAKNNASISGAEVGCQGEVGVASAMAAALIAHVHGEKLQIVENAAESALEHHLGMTCDPIGGYVQIPCIERNAVGAVTAYNAYLIASGGNPDKHKLSFDEVIEAMLETGQDMRTCYKETSRGGLATCSLCH
jgi:L-serine dehydratase